MDTMQGRDPEQSGLPRGFDEFRIIIDQNLNPDNDQKKAPIVDSVAKKLWEQGVGDEEKKYTPEEQNAIDLLRVRLKLPPFRKIHQDMTIPGTAAAEPTDIPRFIEQRSQKENLLVRFFKNLFDKKG
ncbi:hypothetical protein HY732_01125 [Candidatus Uhrbacteria bacterium]|nr:hypothetical protein [Candidatus Uhrbacteria bacterium]